MIDALLSAFITIVSGPSILFLIAGVVIGLIVGVIPGFGWTVCLSLLLPFVFGMEPISGIAMMMGLLSVVATSDTFPAVLIGVPGSVSAQATVMDGFPLAKKGQAARALSAAKITFSIDGPPEPITIPVEWLLTSFSSNPESLMASFMAM